jgi:radical SAM protein with 4Fe4S-binding SPASM domain
MLKKQMSCVEKLSVMTDTQFDGTYNVTYFGGEPLLEINNIILFDKWLKRNYNIKFSFLQTNALLLNETVKNTLKNQNINIGISCDGEKDNNHHHFENLVKENVIPVQAKTMISNYNLSIMEPVNYFYKIAMKNNCEDLYIDISFVKENIWNEDNVSIIKDELLRLKEFLIFHYKNYHRWIRIGFVERILENIVLGKRNFVCFAGKNGFSLTPEGIIYPCSRFYTNDYYRLCDSNEEKFYYDNIKFVASNNNTINDKCNQCKINKFCNQGCLYAQYKNGGIIDGYCLLLNELYNMVSGLYLFMNKEYNIDITKKGWWNN